MASSMTGECSYCRRTIGEVDSCISTLIVRRRRDEKPRIRHKGTERCKGCGVKPQTGYHHPTCLIEVCPHCGKPFMKCYCSLVEGPKGG